MLRLDGLRGSPPKCARCRAIGRAGELVRCRDCHDGGELLCVACCVSAHRRLPFHVVEVRFPSFVICLAHSQHFLQKWMERLFIRTTLKELGAFIQLGHQAGDPCSHSVPGPAEFMVMHTNGLHPINILFCQCDQVSKAGNHIQQLLRFELYPATLSDPTTCATFRMMETFHLLTLQSKMTAYDYYISLNNMTDNTGTAITWVRAAQFLLDLKVNSLRHSSTASSSSCAWFVNGGTSNH